MGGYSDTSLYIPNTETELETVQFNLYNAFLTASGYQPISYEIFKTCNPKIVFEAAKQYDLQTENTMGLMYTQMVSFVQKTAEALRIEPFGCTTVGLTNALLNLTGVTGVAIDEPNRLDSTIDYANIEVAIDGDPNSDDLFSTFLGNIGGGILTNGDKSVSGADSKGVSRVYKYSGFTTMTLTVKLFFKYDENYYGNRLQTQQIIDKYVEHWNDVYKVGNDLLPAKFNDISFYPSLAYLDSQFSTDGGTTFFDRNAIVDSDFNQKFTLDTDITAEQE